MHKHIPAVIIASLLGACPAWASEAINQDEAAALRRQGIIQPLKKILHAAQQLHSGRVMEVELGKQHDLYIYEIEIVDSAGRVWEMKFNAQTASLITQKQDN